MIGSMESGVVDMFCGQQKYSLAHQWIDNCHLSSQLHSVCNFFIRETYFGAVIMNTLLAWLCDTHQLQADGTLSTLLGDSGIQERTMSANDKWQRHS